MVRSSLRSGSSWDTARRGALRACLATLAVSNVVGRLAPAGALVPWNLGVTAVLLRIAGRAGCDAAALGLERRRLGRGLRVGTAGAVAVGAAYAAALSSPKTRPALLDERADASPRGMLWIVAVRIPLGVVVPEEIAFRAVLPALLKSNRRGRAVASVLFGLWHILSSADVVAANSAAGRTAATTSPLLPRTAVVVSTGLAGAALQACRHRGGHVIAPAVVHTATNVLGYLIAWTLRRSGG